MYVHHSASNPSCQGYPCPYDIGKHVNENEKCISTSNLRGDGIWDYHTGRWVQTPCKRKDCPRHWRRYAIRKYAQYRHHEQARLHTFHVRLSCKRFIKQGERFQAINKFLDKMKAEYPDLDGFAIFHRNRAGDHIHLGLGTDDIDADRTMKANVKTFWKCHFPGKKTGIVFDSQCVYVKEHRHLPRLFWYGLMGTKEKPRKRAPWCGIPLRTPVKCVTIKRAKNVRIAA